jgi:NADH-quinone oxidoreductase subunit J
MMESRLFGVFSGLTIMASLRVVRLPHPVHAVLSLIAAFVCASALMILLQLEFMALIFVVVYVGAIAVLFLFVVMMLNLAPSNEGRRSGAEILASFLVAMTLYRRLTSSHGELMALSSDARHGFAGFAGDVTYVEWITRVDSRTSIDTLGQVLYTHRFIYVLMAGFVLLVALVGAIVLTLKVRHASIAKRQQIYQQLSRDADHAVRYVLSEENATA